MIETVWAVNVESGGNSGDQTTGFDNFESEWVSRWRYKKASNQGYVDNLLFLK